MPKTVPVRGYLIHITHYDPVWAKRKDAEKPFDIHLGLELVQTLVEEGFNLLVIDCADGVKYRSHPEYAKDYSVPMSTLEELARHARDAGMDVVPKLNFSRSEINQHNHWMRAPGSAWHEAFDDEAYWEKAFEVIDEVIAACQPRRYFHIGMDEDHQRSHAQYGAAIKTLRAGLKKRKLRTLIWNDSGITFASGLHHAEKSAAAERMIPKDIVHILWGYHSVPEAAVIRRITDRFELWGAPGWRDAEQARTFRDAVLRAGGKGLLMTNWTACCKENRKGLLTAIRAMGPIYSGGET